MLLNEAKRLGVLHGRTLRITESTLIDLRWDTFEAWVWRNRDRILRARFRPEAEQKEESLNTEGLPPLQMMTNRSEAGHEVS